MLDQAQSLRNLADVDDKPDFSTKYNNEKTRIITVTSGKGGVGKSNFVVNLAITLQNKGKKILIFDADIGMGNDDILMGLSPMNNIFDIVFTHKKIKDIIVEGPCGINLIPGGSGLNRIETLTEYEKSIFLNELEKLEGYDYIIMDTGAGITKDILSFINASDELIILTTPEPTAITDAYAIIKATDNYRLRLNAMIMVNKAFTIKEGIQTFVKLNNVVSRFLKIKVEYLGCILEDRKVVESVRKQIPFTVLHPLCNASKNVEDIANKIIGEKKEMSVGVRGLFKKIFNIRS